MSRILYIVCLCFVAISCERRALTYNFDPTVMIRVNVDWSDMSSAPTGMSIYCYPEDGGAPTKSISNTISTATFELRAGVYDILVFNQIPSDYGTLVFDGMDHFETASINAVSSTTRRALTAKSSDDETIREPEEVAVATYLRFEVTDEAVSESVELKSRGYTKSDELIYKTLSFTPRVVIRNTQVRIRVTGIHNYSSATARLYGMATGYNFSQAKSHSDMATHALDSWVKSSYDYDSKEGEISIIFSCFGLPNQTSSSQVEDYADWEGLLDIDITLVDLKTIVSESIPLCDKISTNADDDTRADETVDDLDMGIDINISSGYGLSEGDDAVVLHDVTPAGSTDSGFDATIDPWGDEVELDVPI